MQKFTLRDESISGVRISLARLTFLRLNCDSFFRHGVYYPCLKFEHQLI